METPPETYKENEVFEDSPPKKEKDQWTLKLVQDY